MSEEAVSSVGSEAPAASAFRPAGGPTPWVYSFSAALYGGVARLWNRLELRNPELLPESGPVLVLPNHASFLDPPLVGCFQRREFQFLARDNLLRIPLLGRLLRAYNTHPIRREGVDREAIRLSVEILRAGWPLVVFPEGTRSPDGRARPPLGGFGMIVDRVPGVSCMPVKVEGTGRALGRGMIFLRPAKITITNGAPFTIEPRGEGETRRAFYDRCAARVEAAWRELGVFDP